MMFVSFNTRTVVNSGAITVYPSKVPRRFVVGLVLLSFFSVVFCRSLFIFSVYVLIVFDLRLLIIYLLSSSISYVHRHSAYFCFNKAWSACIVCSVTEAER